MMEKMLPIGIDSFREIREQDRYYVDKSLMIKDFIQYGDEAALITRPRRFGKTLNMTMLREFFDITKDSRDIFNGLAIMETEYAVNINSRPVIYITLKDCKADTAESLLFKIKNLVLSEYDKYYRIIKVIKGNADKTLLVYRKYFALYEKLCNDKIEKQFLETSLALLEEVLTEYYKIKPVVLIDEYDQPIISSYEYNYHDTLKTFFSGFYGSALKGQENLHQAMLTGVQRVAKEGIFSGLNNLKVYTVVDGRYSNYFGFTKQETEVLLKAAGLELDESVKQMYDGYMFGRMEVYNPWSVLNYAESKELKNYWINTSNNILVKESISEANSLFKQDFDKLVENESVDVTADLESSFSELKNNAALWGLLVNAGYVTVIEKISATSVKLRIPNDEVRSEFLEFIAEFAYVSSNDLRVMFDCLFKNNIHDFIAIYKKIIMDYVSFYDVAENSYHMLFLGMCISINKLYKVSSNLERGFGRYDILMESKSESRPHIIIEFKKAEKNEKTDKLKETALQQIKDNRYYNGLTGEVICLGIAHDKKQCDIAYELIVADD